MDSVKITNVAPGTFDIEAAKGNIHRLKIGDIVCTCRYEHLKVVEIFPERFLKTRWRWFSRFVP